MIGIVLVTHGRLADELRSALEHVVGTQSQIEAIAIGPDDDITQRREQIIRSVHEVDTGEGVTQAEVMEVFGRNVVRLRSLLETALSLLPEDDDCPCQHALDGLRLPFELP